MKTYQKILLCIAVPCLLVLMGVGLYYSQLGLLREEGVIMNAHGSLPAGQPMGVVVATPVKRLPLGTYQVLSIKKNRAGYEITLEGRDLPCIATDDQVLVAEGKEATFEVTASEPRQYVLRLPADYPNTGKSTS